ncbi:PaaI family thioesterase [Virgibacillus sp. DJP39]|uniref:PaaI family thioesterase n=1 Tax=Virgibacillus sp. DJP39 TaxID=3409790 RepID=UPI003BB77523
MVTEKIIHAIQDDYPSDFAWCFGCGRLNESGHHFRTTWDGNNTITTYIPNKEHTAIPGFVYGGLIASLIDCHGTGSASLALHRENGYEPGVGEEPPRFVTGSLQVDFLKPTPQDVPLVATGTIEKIHPKKWKVLTEVYADGVVSARGEVLAVIMPESFTRNK